MSDLKPISEEDLNLFFESNLRDRITDRELKRYVVSVMTDFMHSEKFFLFFDERAESVRFDAIFKQDKIKAYNLFKDIGDSYLWFCGFYPEFLSKKKKSRLGLETYIEYGKESYNYAVYIGNAMKNSSLDTRTISRASDNFVYLARAIFDFRSRVDSRKLIYTINPGILEEIRNIMYNGRNIPELAENPMLKIIR